jgi:hypothetical protein
MLRRVALVRTDVGISSQRGSVISYDYRSYFADYSLPDNGGTKFLRNVRSYKSDTP